MVPSPPVQCLAHISNLGRDRWWQTGNIYRQDDLVPLSLSLAHNDTITVTAVQFHLKGAELSEFDFPYIKTGTIAASYFQLTLDKKEK